MPNDAFTGKWRLTGEYRDEGLPDVFVRSDSILVFKTVGEGGVRCTGARGLPDEMRDLWLSLEASYDQETGDVKGTMTSASREFSVFINACPAGSNNKRRIGFSVWPKCKRPTGANWTAEED